MIMPIVIVQYPVCDRLGLGNEVVGKSAYAHTSDYSRMRQLTATVMRSLRGHSALADLSGDRGLPSGES